MVTRADGVTADDVRVLRALAAGRLDEDELRAELAHDVSGAERAMRRIPVLVLRGYIRRGPFANNSPAAGSAGQGPEEAHRARHNQRRIRTL